MDRARQDIFIAKSVERSHQKRIIIPGKLKNIEGGFENTISSGGTVRFSLVSKFERTHSRVRTMCSSNQVYRGVGYCRRTAGLDLLLCIWPTLQMILTYSLSSALLPNCRRSDREARLVQFNAFATHYLATNISGNARIPVYELRPCVHACFFVPSPVVGRVVQRSKSTKEGSDGRGSRRQQIASWVPENVLVLHMCVGNVVLV